jgi:hypothetical protein
MQMSVPLPSEQGKQMTKDEILIMVQHCWPGGPREMWCVDGELPRLERFAALVAEKEREACAKVCEDTPWSNWFTADCAAAIRARGNT